MVIMSTIVLTEISLYSVFMCCHLYDYSIYYVADTGAANHIVELLITLPAT